MLINPALLVNFNLVVTAQASWYYGNLRKSTACTPANPLTTCSAENGWLYKLIQVMQQVVHVLS